MRAVCIIGLTAGGGEAADIADAVHDLARAEGWQSACVIAEDPGQATELARQAAEQADLVIAAGDDAAARGVASGLVGTRAALGIIPVGSGSGLARALGLPLDARSAIAALPRGRPRPFDVGTVNGRMFFRFAGFGLDAERRRQCILPHVWSAVLAWLSYEPETVKITIADKAEEERVLILAVANTEHYGAGVEIAPGARPDDGLLRAARLLAMPFWRWLAILPRLAGGTVGRARCCRATDAAKITVEREKPGLILIDGEPVEAEATLHFRVMPGALRVWLPRPR